MPSGAVSSIAASRATISDELADLARDEVGDLLGPLDGVEVAAAGVGHALEEGVREVLPHPERARADAPGPQLAGVTGQLSRIGDPLVRQAVGQPAGRCSLRKGSGRRAASSGGYGPSQINVSGAMSTSPGHASVP